MYYYWNLLFIIPGLCLGCSLTTPLSFTLSGGGVFDPNAVCSTKQLITCVCKPGWRPDLKKNACVDIDECAEGISKMGLYGNPSCSARSCINTQGSYRCCKRGYRAVRSTCVEVDECLERTAECQFNAQCINTDGNYTCCPRGFQASGSGLTARCTDVDECLPGNIFTHNCSYPSACVNTNGSFTCCEKGLENNGKGVCVDMNECTLRLHNCSHLYSCYNMDRTFGCCGEGYESVNGTCTDINECKNGAKLSHNCSSSSTCVNTIGSFYCCQSGYQTNETRSGCEDIDECEDRNRLLHNCASRSVCINTPGSFYCCPPGFEANKDRTKCVDINECNPTASKRHNCADTSYCVNTQGSFYCCHSGFASNENHTDCEDIDECNIGSIVSHNCSASAYCVNTNGSFYCCDSGYQANLNHTTCVDINECQSSSIETNNCSVGEYCINKIGSFTCQACDSVAKKEIDPKKDHVFRVLEPYIDDEKYPFRFRNCFGSCQTGIFFYTYPPLGESCYGRLIGNESFCSFACTNYTKLTTADLAIDALIKEFKRGEFLQDVMSILFKTNVTVGFSINSKKRVGSGLFLDFNPCPQDMSSVTSFITALSYEITPNVPNLRIYPDTCSLEVKAYDSKSGLYLVPLIISSVGAFLLFLIIVAILLYRKWNQSLVTGLPSEVASSFVLYEKSFDWDYRGTKTAGYYSKRLPKGSAEFKHAESIFQQFGSSLFIVKSILAVYNPVLIKNFVSTYKLQNERGKSEASYEGLSRWTEQHLWVYEDFQKQIKKYRWNDDPGTPAKIIPVCHGTDFTVAEKICQTGFASLSSIDAGYYGKGIYFTTYANYTVPYIQLHRRPSIIVSWILPGHPYPVIEHHQSDVSLLGAAMKSGYNSHYVVTNRQGVVADKGAPEHFNEICIVQESQIVPAWIFELDNSNMEVLAQKWNRKVATL